MASSSSRRPLPQVIETKTSPLTLNENGESDSGGRRHITSSVARTLVTPQTEKAVLNKLKQKMTFSDHSVTSSAKSTPSKVIPKCLTDPRKPHNSGRSFKRTGLMTEPDKQSYKSVVGKPRMSASSTRQGVSIDVTPSIPTSFSYVKMASSSRKEKNTARFEEEEITSSVTISSLLSKLDSVKSYLKEAEEMRMKFDERKTEPGMLVQLNKLDKLVEQLQEQESGYLGELLRLMDMDSSGLEGSEPEEEEGEEFIEEEDSADEEEEEKGLSDEEAESIVHVPSRKSVNAVGDKGSLSLRAQMELEQQDPMNLLALQQQKQMLTQLLEKQKQIQELEAKQAALLEMKTNAEEQLKEAESKGLDLQQSKTQVNKASNKQQSALRLSTRLAERTDQISQFLYSMGRSEGEKSAGNASDGMLRSLQQNVAGVRSSVQATRGGGAGAARRDELVPEDVAGNSGPSMGIIAQLSRDVADVRRSLKEAEDVMSLPTRVKEKRKKSAGPLHPQKMDRKTEKLKSSLNDSLEQDASELERSRVSDYEAKLSRKREDVLQLLKEREELRATHKELLTLQKMNITQFLDDSLQQGADHDVYSQTDVTGATWGGSTVQSDPEEEEDDDDDDDAASSATLPSDVDIARESNPDNDDITGMSVHGDGATIEQVGINKIPPPLFMVTRHTPRLSNNVRARTSSQDLTFPDQKAKKIKVEEKSSNEKHRSANPLLKSSGAKPTKKEPAKDGALFGNSNDSHFVFGCGNSKDNRFVLGGGAVVSNPPPMSGPPVFSTSFGAASKNHQSLGAAPNVGNSWGEMSFQPRDSLLSQQHTDILQNQLTLTSGMCNQLLQGQNNLIRAVCQRLDHTELQSSTQEQMAGMQQYQMELEGYYHQLCESYMLLKEQQKPEVDDGGIPESEEPVASAAPAMGNGIDNEGSLPQPPMPSGVSFQMEPAEGIAEPVLSGPSQPWSHPQFYTGPQPKPLDLLCSRAGPMSYLPPLPPFPGNPYYTSPGFFVPGEDPTQSHNQFYGSPLSYLPPAGPRMGPTPFQYKKSPSLSHGMPSFSFRNSVFPHSPQYSQACAQGAGRLPYFYRNPSLMVDTGSNFDTHGQYGNGPLSFQAGSHAERGVGFGNMGSPSGVTASSLQVNAPTSPTSVPSDTMQPSSENASNTNSNQPQETEAPSQCAAAAAVTTTASKHSLFLSARTRVSGGGTLAVSSAVEAKKTEHQGIADDDVESMSSLPCVPDKPQACSGEGGFSVFESLRDTIYSEVASFIASNESRPHFLVELFRELQLLSTDYLRQRALYSLQDLVTRFMAEDTEVGGDGANASWLMEESDNASDGSSSVVHSKPFLLNRSSQDYDDDVEAVHSASAASTPTTHEPFMSNSVQDTVKKLDQAMAHLRLGRLQAETSGSLDVSGLSEQQAADAIGGGKLHENIPLSCSVDMDSRALDEQIKNIMIDVIPVLKSNIEKDCGIEMMAMISNRIVELVLEQEKDEKPEYLESFRNQLYVSVNTVTEKYCNKKLRYCGEDMLMDVSEVLFNELAFFKIMQGCRGQTQLQESGNLEDLTLPRAASEDEEIDVGVPEAPDEVGQIGGSGFADELKGRTKPVDASLLQMLTISANLSLLEEEDALGKVRDDVLATMWDPSIHNHERSLSDDQEVLGMEELLGSESRPPKITEKGESYVAVVGSKDSTGQDCHVLNTVKSLEGRDVTPPTPSIIEVATTPPALHNVEVEIALPSALAGASLSSTPELPPPDMLFADEDRDVTIEKAATIGKSEEDEEETGAVNHQPLPARSPPTTAAAFQESDLESRVKMEQRAVEGIDGVLASMKEQAPCLDMDLVGDGEDVPTHVNGI